MPLYDDRAVLCIEGGVFYGSGIDGEDFRSIMIDVFGIEGLDNIQIGRSEHV